MSVAILGISAYYHDSAAVLLRDGAIVAAAQEERFSRRKHDARFPAAAIDYCLREADLRLPDINHIVFYDKPLLKFERLLETYLACVPRGLASFTTAMPIWLKEKLFQKGLLMKELAEIGSCREQDLPKLLFTGHHEAHAASAFFPSPFERAGVLCLDGVGEWATTSIWLGEGSRITPQWELHFPHSLGLLYSSFTSYIGFKVNSGEYKLMGLAPYGKPSYVDIIRSHLVDIREDGSFRLNMEYFDFASGLTMANSRFYSLFGGEPRLPESSLDQRHMDIARSIQEVTEEIVLRLARTVARELSVDRLCMAGGVALNCVANGRVLRDGIVQDLWVQPASGDAGGALGATLACWHSHLGMGRIARTSDDMQGSLLGPRFSMAGIREDLDRIGARYEILNDAVLMPRVAELLAGGKVLGWFQGRMEYGPRALGARSILGDPRESSMQSVMNRKIKFRESFRPFAPSVLEEDAGAWFDLDGPSPYMLIVAQVRQDRQVPPVAEQRLLSGIDLLQLPRSTIPAVTHVDMSSRIQTVNHVTNPRFHALIAEFNRLTGCPVLINTSFNVRGEPIVCSPEDAYRCFLRTEMDYLVIENALLARAQQPTQKVECHDRNDGTDQRGRRSDSRTLRTFGLMLGTVIAGMFGLAMPWLYRTDIPRWPWVTAVPLAVIALTIPRALRGFYLVWTNIGRALGAVNTRIVLTVLFFFVIFPAGLVMRLFGRDPLSRRFDRDAHSYRILSDTSTTSSMEKPY